MKIDVSKIVKAEGAFQEVSLDIDFDRLSFNGQDFLFVAPMKIDGIIKNAGGNLYLDATVSTRFTTVCARCLKEITEDFDFDISEVFSQGEVAEDSVFLPIVSNAVDIKSVVEDNFCTSVPFVFICDKDCKGLCHNCGHNLNEGECGCDNEEIDPRLSGLKAFLKND